MCWHLCYATAGGRLTPGFDECVAWQFGCIFVKHWCPVSLVARLPVCLQLPYLNRRPAGEVVVSFQLFFTLFPVSEHYVQCWTLLTLSNIWFITYAHNYICWTKLHFLARLSFCRKPFLKTPDADDIGNSKIIITTRIKGPKGLFAFYNPYSR